MKKLLKESINIFSQFGFSGLLALIKIAIGKMTGKLVKIDFKKFEYPIYLRSYPSDRIVFKQLIIDRLYQIGNETPPMNIIDGGANIGLYSILMKNKYPNVNIVCIEPDINNFNILKQNLSHYKNIYLENCGLWNNETKLSVWGNDYLGNMGKYVKEDLNGDISTISINKIMEKYSFEVVDILKLDIEGSEKYLFSSNYAEWLPKVKLLIIELHDSRQAGCAKSFFTAINNTFENYEFSMRGESVYIKNCDLF